jgi:aryl-alcohol dehydrogenase-like predicted oxidoreductase
MTALHFTDRRSNMGDKIEVCQHSQCQQACIQACFWHRTQANDAGQDANQLLDQVLSTGINVFDTAADYGDSEASLGNWITARKNREEIVVITKGANTTRWRRRLTPHDIMSDFMTSLAKLQTDYVDIYFLHRDDPTAPVGPIVEQLNALHAQGKIRAYGGSNWTIKRIEQANEYAYKHALQPFTVSSPSYSLAEMIADPCGDSVTLSGEQNRAARTGTGKTRCLSSPIHALAAAFSPGN